MTFSCCKGTFSISRCVLYIYIQNRYCCEYIYITISVISMLLIQVLYISWCKSAKKICRQGDVLFIALAYQCNLGIAPWCHMTRNEPPPPWWTCQWQPLMPRPFGPQKTILRAETGYGIIMNNQSWYIILCIVMYSIQTLWYGILRTRILFWKHTLNLNSN